MYDSVLDNLKPNENGDGSLLGSFEYKGQMVTINLDRDGEPAERNLALARKFLTDLPLYENAALERLYEDCFSMYNDDWRVEEDPILDKAQFLNRFTLNHIWFLSIDSVDFFYDDDGMFGNHSMIIQSFDGENFTHVQMYG